MAQNMNVVILEGRMTKDPDIRYSQGENSMAIARGSLGVNRMKRQNEEQAQADFPSFVAFGKTAEIFEKYVRKGSHILINGRLQTGSYTNKDGQKVYTTEVIVNELHLLDNKGNNSGSNQGGNAAGASAGAAGQPTPANAASPMGDGFMNIPDGIDEELPFN